MVRKLSVFLCCAVFVSVAEGSFLEGLARPIDGRSMRESSTHRLGADGKFDPTGRPGGHAAKAAKGRLARRLLTEGLDALDRFTDDRFGLSVTPIGDR